MVPTTKYVTLTLLSYFGVVCYVGFTMKSTPYFQPFQNLEIGDCNGKPVEYCNSLVENSMCNPQKNECFCKHGFVAIQEEENVVCRTLLTELYCRVDSDCVHVDGSVCHPGAGKCVCPSGRIYVPQLHAC
ncbi:hypothetical protein CRM22_006952, partial [Opisthorchis felineus]